MIMATTAEAEAAESEQVEAVEEDVEDVEDVEEEAEDQEENDGDDDANEDEEDGDGAIQTKTSRISELMVAMGMEDLSDELDAVGGGDDSAVGFSGEDVLNTLQKVTKLGARGAAAKETAGKVVAD